MDFDARETLITECTAHCPLTGFEEDIDDYRVAPELTQAEHAQIPAHLYTPLQDWQTRILTIEPGHFGQELVATLSTVGLLHDPGVFIHDTATRIFYDTLSYCWGDPTPCRRLVCNGTSFLVPKEVHNALQRLRSLFETTYIWLDYLCINQSDNVEKSQQVPKMLSIYQKAKVVRVWLGEGNADSRFAATILKEAHACYDPTISDHPDSKIKRWICSGPRLCQWHSDRLRRGVDALASCDWFNRAWVKQEVWAARQVEFIVGFVSLAWDAVDDVEPRANCFKISKQVEEHFREACEALALAFHLLLRGTPIDHVVAQQNDIPNPGDGAENESKVDIVNLLTRFEGSKCTLGQDYVYGLLGMSRTNVSNGQENTLTIDYTRSPRQVFQDLARYIMRMDRSLAILAMSQLKCRESDPRYDICLPSWTPDWRIDFGLEVMRKDQDDCHVFSWLRKYRHTKIDGEGDGVLKIEAIVIGTLLKACDDNCICPSQLTPVSRHHYCHSGCNHDIIRGPDFINKHVEELYFHPRCDELREDTAAELRWPVPQVVEASDILVCATGASSPLVLRPCTNGFNFIGHVKVHDRKMETDHCGFVALQEKLETAFERNQGFEVIDIV